MGWGKGSGLTLQITACQHWRVPQTNAYHTTSQHPAAPAPAPTPQGLHPTQAGLGLSLHYYLVF